MIGDYDAFEVVYEGYRKLSGDPAEAGKQASRLLSAFEDACDGLEQRDAALRHWEKAFAPNRPFGVQFPKPRVGA